MGGAVPLFSTHPVCDCHAKVVLLDSSLLLKVHLTPKMLLVVNKYACFVDYFFEKIFEVG